MTYYFPQSEEVYKTKANPSILNELDQCATLYLYEPEDRLGEPFHGVWRGQTIATCSPDERRYKEFEKRKL